MKTWQALRWVFLGTVLALSPGCLELLGQRITLRYDREHDRVMVLLHYDGIHNNKERDQASAERKLREFVEHGSAMLLDWYGVADPVDIRDAADSEQTPPRLRALARHVAEHATVHRLGHYRDPSGRIGAAQLIVLERATELVALANAAIHEAVLAATERPAADQDAWRATRSRWRQYAEQRREWLQLEGHAVVFRCPVEDGEWQREKMRWLAELAQPIDQDGEDADDAGMLRRLVAVAPLSLDQRAGQVAARWGEPDQPTVARVRWPRTYRNNVEELVTQLVPTDLDDALVGALLRGEAATEPVAALIAWGPPEDQVRAVLAQALHASGTTRQSALAWLHRFATRWNGDRSFPAAPSTSEDLAGWTIWYERLVAEPEA